jgi:hypothetical protein
MTNRKLTFLAAVIGGLACLVIASCNTGTPPSTLTATISTPIPPSQTPGATSTSTLAPTVTFTPEPLAAMVNGQPITLVEFQQELARYRLAQSEVTGTNLATENATDETIVLNDLIDQVLLAQASMEQGYILEDSVLEQKFQQLADQTDLNLWLQSQGYSEESFRHALGRSIQAAWMRDQILATVPAMGEQIHARQILLYNLEEANQVHANLKSGADFSRLAALYDPVAAGDLGWFPRGYLTVLAVEEAAFRLQPGEFSPVIESDLGFHIIQVIEREPQRPLESDLQLVLQLQALKAWLIERREKSDIQVFMP